MSFKRQERSSDFHGEIDPAQTLLMGPAKTMLYAARECARIMLGYGLEARHARHRAAVAAVAAMTAGLRILGLMVFAENRFRISNVTAVCIRAASALRACAGARVSISSRDWHCLWTAGGQGVALQCDGLRRTHSRGAD